ncbi:polyribonucleotide nucleotidyltransferase [Riemerella anatipestifer]|uniref:Polyribonucleotide nucleotidyltransferase n=1 Tax=Riemerella anatipestifer (strain ATCC 11845 / DSM 15868 / JCM 9532 / NCTC 11014) TaxID=693978 RepID=E4T9V8_RIEAD|nr:polyribonucleotide nucleotidyltransferase [Riemerella anatipestifer]ADQ81789.1 polyribonucleotide nucleotidyltransferase [Riemerella anatipestifer ATCC 11845 = DSM 15868]ADZ12711.1 Polyribonucleotide nucleotidyltransferase (polynucleotide phosphorylase) [Riemerella anatipestifer RA-GD]AFD55799.1 polyribonucleotide nucleotidyltransferase [Riemerella anatipestifer ATCC 11845 = DSM 15868]AGC40298.1 Polyribonucleotide nucleotidyltransferase (polynucleotide phosphorylase) [Riemerella anatipestife
MNAPQAITETILLKDGREITIETGKLAKQADGAVVVKMGGTMLLATVVAAKEANPGVDFLPLTVDYREKFGAAGRIPGNFFRREAKPSDDEVLTMRLVDRVIRPLFPSDFHAEVQVMISLISYDEKVMPDSLAGLAASAAIAITDIPFNGPFSEVRVIKKDGVLSINPSWETLQSGVELDIMVGATKDSIVMVEGEMDEITEQEMLEAITFAHQEIKTQVEAQERLAQKVGKAFPKREYCHETHDEELKKQIWDYAYQKYYDIAKNPSAKEERGEKFSAVVEEFLAQYTEEELEEKADLAKVYFHDVQKEAVRQLILNENIRLDGRNNQQIRPIWSEVDYLPAAHGSSVFTRGETQSLTTVTLGSLMDANRIDSVITQHDERFYLHYNFPPFSTGEARPLRGTSRREVGHGNLAQRALKVMIPEETPYTIRIVSDILESNGSSSMATVCAGTLALMDAGIPMRKPVSGIAMGLITDKESGKWTVLSDILGDEDHLGDMDFKVTGTENGITACQMDIKIQGLTMDIMEQALMQAKNGRLHILGEMLKTISEPRADVKPHAPKMVMMEIPKDFIGAVIGPGGKVIQQMQKETGTVITIEEKGEIGYIEISGTDREKINAAIAQINEITFIPIVGEVYQGKVVKVMDFGAFVQLAKGTEGLLHISEIDWKRTDKVPYKEGDIVEVKFMGYDDRKKMKLSRKVLLPKPPREEKSK